jgi:tRNA nucleotidyltransferase (CCA-adding enzyme)
MKLDFSGLLSSNLSTAQLQLIRAVVDEAALYELPLYVVGGLPRDLLLGVAHSDLDLVVEGDAIALARSLVAKYGGEVTAHPKFGTARWALRETKFGAADAPMRPSPQAYSGDFLDLISARSETYDHPAALPSVRMGKIEDDLGRRDFTINTLAVRLDGAGIGQVRDDFGALEDLKRGIVRVLHARSFTDDPTRMYRAVRYEQRFGFSLADGTLALMPAARSLVERLSGQRIRHELDLILDEERAETMLIRLGKLDLLRPIHADLPRDKVALSKVKLAKEAPAFSVPNWTAVNAAWVLWLIARPQRQIVSIQERLHFTGALAQSIRSASSLRGRLPALARWRPSKCVAYLDKLPPLAVYAAYRGVRAGRSRTVLQKYLAHWRLLRPTTTGKDLKQLGLAPSPEYATILRALRDAWLDGLVGSADEERLLLRSILRRQLRKRSAPHRITRAAGNRT